MIRRFLLFQREGRFWALIIVAVCVSLSVGADPDRSPVDLVIHPSGDWIVTANQGSHTVSLLDVAGGKVVDEVKVAERPAAIAVAEDGKVLVSSSYGGELALFRVAGSRLDLMKTIRMEGEPHGIAVTRDCTTAYVALASLDRVAVVDLDSGSITSTIDVGRWPRYVALSPDGSRLAVGTSGDRGITIVDTLASKGLFTEQFVGLNIGHMQTSADGQYVYFPWMVYRRNPITPGNIRLGWVLASRIARVRLDEKTRREALSLDPQGKAIADPHGLALTTDDQHVVVSASGTRELLVYRLPDLPLKKYGGTDHIPPELLKDNDRFYRIELGGRPMGLRIARDNRRVYIANYLGNSVQEVDLAERAISRTINLGGPDQPSLARQGESIFFDGRRSLDQWYSCHSCHYEGGSNSVVMDTMNDGTRFSFKTVLPLFNVDRTGPWTWHGWQDNLDDAMHKSLTSTMLGPTPDDNERAALIAYLSTLRTPPNPYRSSRFADSAAIERGKDLFHSDRAGCSACHNGTYFTDGEVHDVGLGGANARYVGFNTPSLLGAHRKVLYLHDGRSKSLEDLLKGPHSPAIVSGTAEFGDDEIADLVAYLRSL